MRWVWISLFIVTALQRVPGPPSDVKVKGGPTSITWTQIAPVNPPFFPDWTHFEWDPVKQELFWPAVDPGNSNIFVTSLFGFKSSTLTFTRYGGTGSTGGHTCDSGSASPQQPWPPDSHVMQQYFVVRSKGFVVWVPGVCNGNLPLTFYKYDLTTRAWSVMGTFPSNMPSLRSVTAYDQETDKGVLFGSNPDGNLRTWECAFNGTSSCAWTNVTPSAQPTLTTDTTSSQLFCPQMLHKCILFLKDPSSGVREVWTYASGTHAWAKASNINVPVDGQSPTMDFDHVLMTSGPFTNFVLFVKPTPRSFSACNGSETSTAYAFDLTTLKYSAALKQTGTGPTCLVYVGWDESFHGLIGVDYQQRYWRGTVQ